jgi:hypothetical protein
MKRILLPAFALLLVPTVLPAAPPRADEEVRIPFARFGAVRNFQNEGDRIVYFEGRRRQWYRATLFAPCINLPHALRLGFETRYGDVLDNSTTLLVDGEACRIESLVRSDPPPRRRRGHR